MHAGPVKHTLVRGASGLCSVYVKVFGINAGAYVVSFPMRRTAGSSNIMDDDIPNEPCWKNLIALFDTGYLHRRTGPNALKIPCTWLSILSPTVMVTKKGPLSEPGFRKFRKSITKLMQNTFHHDLHIKS